MPHGGGGGKLPGECIRVKVGNRWHQVKSMILGYSGQLSNSTSTWKTSTKPYPTEWEYWVLLPTSQHLTTIYNGNLINSRKHSSETL